MKRIAVCVFAVLLGLVLLAPAAGGADPKIGSIKANPADGADMVYVPAGEFTMGSNTDTLDEKPVHKVTLDGYWIYRYEVTVAQYRTFCDSTSRTMPRTPDWAGDYNMPMTSVTWYDAQAYAKWAGGRLPTEAEWEKAARGPDGSIYPWGDEDDKSRYAEGSPGLVRPNAVGTFPYGASVYGCEDMAGNVAEWCLDWYGSRYYTESPEANPAGSQDGASSARVVRSSEWRNTTTKAARCSNRLHATPNDYFQGVGFRVVVGGPAVKVNDVQPVRHAPATIAPVTRPALKPPTPRKPPAPAKPITHPAPKAPSVEIVKIDGTDNFISGAVVFNGSGVGGIAIDTVNAKFATLRNHKTTSAADGSYKMGPLPDGDYHIYVTASGNPGYFNRFTTLARLNGGQMAKMPPLSMGREIEPISPKAGDIVSPSPQGLKIVWTGCEGTARYHVTISDTAASQKVADAIETTPAALIKSDLLQRGKTYQVSVRAYSSNNEFIAGTAGCGATLWRFTVK